ncbi:MAG: metallopeptidase family protein [Acidimicrobiales bacterium]
MRLTRERFHRLVTEALDELPPFLAAHMSNVDIVVEELPGDEVGGEFSGEVEALLGLYQGIPLTERDSQYFGVLPDRITLYKRNIERATRTEEEVREAVRRTVIHEIAHHFGIGDARLDELGWS